MRRLFLSVTWSPNTDALDARLLVRTLESLYSELRRSIGNPNQFDPLPSMRIFGAWTIQSIPAEASYQSVDWFYSHSMDDKGEAVLASRFVDVVRLEPWQASFPHFDFSLTDLTVCDDITSAQPCDEVVGVSRRGLVSLVSTRPLLRIRNNTLRHMAMEMAFYHYLGMMFGGPSHTRQPGTIELRHGQPYCRNRCALRYIATIDTALAIGQDQKDERIIFCQDCRRDLIANLAGSYIGMN